jgi:rod shape-determining protein MreC
MRRPTRRQRLTLIVLLVLSVVFVTLDSARGTFAGLRSGVAAVFGPEQRGLAAIFTPVGRFFGGIPHLASSRHDADTLRQQNAELRRQLAEQAVNSDRARQLARLGLLAGLGRYRVLPAAVVSLGPSLGFEWTATIDAGSADGLRPDMTVVTGAGLVGRVKQVGRSTSVVVLAVDPGSSVGARVAGSDQLGLATGDGTGPMVLTLLDPNAAVRPGDRLVTGPFGKSTYVAGVPIGEVVSVGGDTGGAGPRTATVRPYVEFGRLDLVGVVIAAPRTDPRDSVLPPRPTATPTATPTAMSTSSGGPGGVGGPGGTASPGGAGVPGGTASPTVSPR